MTTKLKPQLRNQLEGIEDRVMYIQLFNQLSPQLWNQLRDEILDIRRLQNEKYIIRS